MKKWKRLLTSLLAAALLCAALPSALAAVEDTGFADVAADAWYADAVEYARDNGLMNGNTATTFNPNGTTSRGQIAAILYRASGSPAVTGGTRFPDVADTAYYASASRWASANGIVTGYANGNFGPNDPITRQQMAAILWRYAGSPAVGAGEAFADEGAISSYASGAVDWARANGVINGKAGNLFDPNGRATRAQVAVILRNYMELDSAAAPDNTPGGSRVLVAYYSATGSTQAVAETIAETLNGDLFAITPAQPYTSGDLNWNNPSSRVSREHDDASLRDVALTATTVENWDDYDTVFIGYPIWWGIAAWPVDGFVSANDFAGKTVIPFATSSSSGMGQSGALLADLAGSGDWQAGRRFSSGVSAGDVRTWVGGLNLTAAVPAPAPNPAPQESRSLVAYFSMPETTDPNNMTTEEANSTVVIDGQVLGNTQYMAYVIQETTGADIFRIEPATPYPTDHETLVDLAAQEQDENARPAMASRVGDLDRYDVIYLGYPNWWGDMPMILYSFLEEYDLSGKTIVPFNTHGGSGFSGTINTIRTLEPDAMVLNGLSISRGSIQDAEREIIDWVNGLDI